MLWWSQWERTMTRMAFALIATVLGCSAEPDDGVDVPLGGNFATGGAAGPYTGGAGLPSGGGFGPTGGAWSGPGGFGSGGSMIPGMTGGDMMPGMAGGGMMPGMPGDCCPDGNCICRGDAPTALTSREGPYDTDSYSLRGVGCVYYPTDGEPPYSAVAVSDGLLGSGGCSSFQTGRWGPFYASHGIVAMIVETGSGDQPSQRGRALLEGIEGFKAENENSDSPLYGLLAGRYGTSGFSMGGGGTTFAASDDSTLLTSVGLMSYGPTSSSIDVPSLFVCGSSDGTASCGLHSERAYPRVSDSVPKMLITVRSGHVGQPSAGGGDAGATALAFQKVFLDGDERWRPILLTADYDETNIQ